MLVKIINIFIGILIFLVGIQTNLFAATITLVETPLLDTDEIYNHVHIQGEIVQGDAQRMFDIVEALPKGSEERLLISLESPGGNLGEGLQIAKILQSAELHVITDIMTKDGKPADCASSCVFIYLGGTFRFLLDGSRVGVHQFKAVQDGLTIRTEEQKRTQWLMAQIADVVSNANVDAKFIALMSNMPPEDIEWIDKKTLEQLNILNRDLSYQENDYVLKKQNIKLVMTHVGLFGVSRLTATCIDHQAVFTSEIGISNPDIDKLETENYIANQYSFSLLADGYQTSPKLVKNQYFQYPAITTIFQFLPNELAALMSAEKLDIRLIDKQGVFLGAKFDISDKKFHDFAESCNGLEAVATSTLGGEQNLEEVLSPVLAAAQLQVIYQTAAPSQMSQAHVHSFEKEANNLYLQYLANWSKDNSEALPLMSMTYNDQVDFYGGLISKEKLMNEKFNFAKKWPNRRYFIIPNTSQIKCTSENYCLVAHIIKWEAHNPINNKFAEGGAWYGLGFDMLTKKVVFENGHSQKL